MKGGYFLNRKPVAPPDLGPMLNNIYSKRTEDKILYIKADQSLDYGVVLDAMDVASRNGVRVSAMVTDQRPGTVSKVAEDNILKNVGALDQGGAK